MYTPIAHATPAKLFNNHKISSLLFHRLIDYLSAEYPEEERPEEKITMEDIRDNMLDERGFIIGGIFAHRELYNLLLESCGDTASTRLAISKNISLHRAENPDSTFWKIVEEEYAV